MRTAYDYAKYFVKKGLDTYPNTFDANMKLQKLLVLADLLSLAKYDTPLFNDEVMAFTKGYVVENVRLKYQNDYASFKKDSDEFVPNFSPEEMYILDCTINIYGSLSARELSDLSHLFHFWSNSYNRGTQENGYHNKDLSIITIDEMRNEISSIRQVLSSYEQRLALHDIYEVINGIRFYYDPGELSIVDIFNYLYEFSKDADDTSYSVYLDDGKVVVY